MGPERIELSTKERDRLKVLQQVKDPARTQFGRTLAESAVTLKNVGWHSVVGANQPSPQLLPRPRSVVRPSEQCKPDQASLVDSSG
jgi:hypothetical protein